MGFGPAYVAHTPPLEGWYSRDSICCGARARVVCGVYNCKKQKQKRSFLHVPCNHLAVCDECHADITAASLPCPMWKTAIDRKESAVRLQCGSLSGLA